MTRNILPPDQKNTDFNISTQKVRNTLPSFIYENKPKFIKFIQGYYDYLEQSGGLLDLAYNLKNARDNVVSKFRTSLVQEFGKNFQNSGTVTDETLLKILKLIYLSKGNEIAVKAYFKIFLEDDNVRVLYPKDNMMIIDGANWDSTASKYANDIGKIDEITMKIQDDKYYQIYSYVIRTGRSLDKWEESFRKSSHPAGWLFFGEIEIVGEAYFRFGTLSPLYIPGSIPRGPVAVLLKSSASHNELGHSQILTLTRPTQQANYYTYDSADLGLNMIGNWPVTDLAIPVALGGGTLHAGATLVGRATIGEYQNFTLEQLSDPAKAIATNKRRGTEIIIS